jgi:hypothetical protein
MDFYKNTEIVREQYDIACKELETGQKVCWNAYMQQLSFPATMTDNTNRGLNDSPISCENQIQ